MATVTELTEDFTVGAIGDNVSTANTIFDNLSGSGTARFIADPYLTGGKLMEVVTAVNTRIMAADFAPRSYLRFYFDIDIATPFDTITAVLSGTASNSGLASDKIFDLRPGTNARTIQLRNVNTGVWISGELAAGQKHRIETTIIPGTSLRVRIFSGGNFTSPAHDSGVIASSAAVTQIARIQMGNLSAVTGTMRFGRIRGEDAEEVAATVNAGADQLDVVPGNVVTLSATSTGAATYAWSQSGGSPAVTLAGSGATRTFTAPPTLTGTTLTFTVTYGVATDSVQIEMVPHTLWRKRTNGALGAVYRQRKT